MKMAPPNAHATPNRPTVFPAAAAAPPPLLSSALSSPIKAKRPTYTKRRVATNSAMMARYRDARKSSLLSTRGAGSGCTQSTGNPSSIFRSAFGCFCEFDIFSQRFPQTLEHSAHLKELRIKLLLLTNFELNSSNNESKSLKHTCDLSHQHIQTVHQQTQIFLLQLLASLTTELNFFTPQICSLKQIYSQENCTIVVSRLKFMKLSASFTDHHHHHHHLHYTIYTQF